MFHTNALIGLREGLEATMVVIILAAHLKKTGQRRSYPWLWGGIAAALVVTVSVFLIIHFGTKTLSTTGQELIGGIASLVTVALVVWMLIWMKGASRNMTAELEGKMEKAVAVGPVAVATVAIIAVAREGIETALLVFDSFSRSLGVPFAGLMTGVGISIVIGVAMYIGAVKINLRMFFQITGALLILVAAGILRYGITDLQEATVLPGLSSSPSPWAWSPAPTRTMTPRYSPSPPMKAPVTSTPMTPPPATTTSRSPTTARRSPSSTSTPTADAWSARSRTSARVPPVSCSSPSPRPAPTRPPVSRAWSAKVSATT
ncbi:hypothetical protein CVAR_1771 [Corynebacterium variabile DSM 44702]|uniref:Iron transporter n=1 Tax=Corynebacterium variabile (strain DSM 44702 / CIP 107183 / JCM 12073 / NCIMB 30131) TaxID=858619 RepID=G0HBL0_CORVD|nr:hypothetical protein CVAR_1771 [Corynebacterium variabile DSM 44702]